MFVNLHFELILSVPKRILVYFQAGNDSDPGTMPEDVDDLDDPVSESELSVLASTSVSRNFTRLSLRLGVCAS